jgi:CHAD domain-containing protein
MTHSQPLTKALRAQTAALADLEPQVREDAPDSVHQMRVTARTLRANLRTFAHELPSPKKRTALVEELAWLGGALGPAREAEVLQAQVLDLLQRTRSDLVIGPVQERVESVFALERESALAVATDALDDPRFRELLKNLDAYSSSLNSDPEKDPTTALGRIHHKLRSRLRHARRMPLGPDRDVAMHQARKSTRRARYAADALGLPTKPIKALQDVLGEEHDRVVTAAALTDLAAGAHLAGENAFTYGVLLGLVRCDSRDFDHDLRKAWRSAKPHLRADKK